jgi:phosphoenolpyruvate carboxylase
MSYALEQEILKLKKEIKKLEFEIQELKDKHTMERLVKESEVQLNATQKTIIEKYELQIQTLVKINEDYANIIANLRQELKNKLFIY